MLTLHLRKFNDFYDSFGLGATKNFHLMVQLVLLGRTANLWKLKDYVPLALGNDSTRPSSHYQRLIRFFDRWSDDDDFQEAIMIRTFRILRRLKFTHLLLDGTSWKRGDQAYHYMVLSVLAGPVAIPIYWKQLGKIGSSNQEERFSLFKEAMQRFDFKGMTLLADREYVGKPWFKFLRTNKLNFVIRVRFGNYYQAVDEAPGKTYQQMYDQCVGRGKFVRKQFKLGQEAFYISMLPNPNGTVGEEAIIYITPIRPVKKTVNQYAKRWRIECFFRHLKSNGFRIEEMNLKPPEKSNLMMAILCFAYALTIKAGWQVQKTIRRIQYKNGMVFPAQSIFRKGLSLTMPRCISITKFLNYQLSLDNGKSHSICKNV